MYRHYNPNPSIERASDDCTVRAIAKATGQSWEHVYFELCLTGMMLGAMPNANAVWGDYLKSIGYRRDIIPQDCPSDYTVRDFCADHPRGTYILAISGHVVCVCDGDYYDTFDSGSAIPLYYWYKGA